LFGASQYLGTLIAPLYGVAGDRLGHKSLLLAMRFSYAVFASTLLAFHPDRAHQPAGRGRSSP
jgi:MFS family permease